jgi:hypothetical protein
MCYCKEKIYILVSIFNFDDVVMSRENWNFHLSFFVKSWALQRAGVWAEVEKKFLLTLNNINPKN